MVEFESLRDRKKICSKDKHGPSTDQRSRIRRAKCIAMAVEDPKPLLSFCETSGGLTNILNVQLQSWKMLRLIYLNYLTTFATVAPACRTTTSTNNA